MNYKKEMEKLKKESLSNYDIFNKMKKQIRILTYPELLKYDDINKVLSPHKCFIILYMSKKNYGHWCCVIKHKNKIEFFDPYGDYMPDDELENINKEFKKESNQDYPYLTYLLYKSKYPIEYNNYNYQKYDYDIRTCGRHCLVRASLKNMELEEYNELMKKIKKDLKMSYDDIVTLLTI